MAHTTTDYINQLKTDLANLKSAYTERGVEVSDDDTFTSLATKSSDLPTGGGGSATDYLYDTLPTSSNNQIYTQLYKFIKDIPLTVDVSNCSTYDYLCAYYYGKTIKLKGGTITAGKSTSAGNMCSSCPNLESIDLSELDSDIYITTLKSAFSVCPKLTNVSLGNLNLSKCTDFSYMFTNTTSIQNLDLSNVDFSSNKTFQYTFNNCNNLTNLNFKPITTNVTSIAFMFCYCNNLISDNVDLSGIGGTITSLASAFRECKAIKKIDLSGLTGTISSASRAFYTCYALEEIDISGFDFSSASAFSLTFNNCNNLQTVYVKDETAKSLVDTALSNAGLTVTSTIKEA